MCDCMRERNLHDCSCHRPTERMAGEDFPRFGNPWRRGRCHHAGAGFGPEEHNPHTCSCHSPKEMTAEEETRILENKKKHLQEGIERIEKRIEDLKPAQDT
jgi:hypothetical protein